MPSSQGFTPERVADGIGRWVREGLGLADAAVVLHEAPAATGHSSETVLFDAEWSGDRGSEHRRFVLRTAPSGHTVFPTYDLDLQYQVMDRVAATGAVPVPELFRYENDDRWIGSPFIVMARVDGQVPPDRLPYTMEGWLLESPPEVQRRVQTTGLETIAAVHAIDWRAAGLDVVDAPRYGATGLDQQLAGHRPLSSVRIRIALESGHRITASGAAARTAARSLPVSSTPLALEMRARRCEAPTP